MGQYISNPDTVPAQLVTHTRIGRLRAHASLESLPNHDPTLYEDLFRDEASVRWGWQR